MFDTQLPVSLQQEASPLILVIIYVLFQMSVCLHPVWTTARVLMDSIATIVVALLDMKEQDATKVGMFCLLAC